MLPETPLIVMKGQVAHWSGFQEEVGTETGRLTTGLTMVTGGTGSTTEMSPAITAGETEMRIQMRMVSVSLLLL